MKGFLYKLGTQTAVTFVMLLLVFAPFQTLVAQADIPSTDLGDTTRAAPAAGVTISNTNVSNNTTIPASNANQYAQQTPTSIFASCGITNLSGCISAIIYAFTIGIASVFAYVAAYFFDITIQLSLNGASYGLDFISTSWTTARDLGNMAFLFILLYIAFTIIFKADTGQTKTMLALVIVVALLVNFSFFFSRVVIDAGNILSIQFYNAIPAPPISQTIQGGSVTSAAVASVSSAIGGTAPGTKDLTAGIMNMLNVQGLLNNQSFAQTNGSFIATIFIYIAGAIVLWLLTIAFVTNGIKFLVRVVILWFLIIASPLALIAIAVEGPGGYFKKWREMLLQHSFYPVAFMFIFLVLNNFAVTMSNSTTLTGGVFATTATTGASSWGAIGASLVALSIRLILVIAMLYAGMKAADTISVKGSETAGTVGGWMGSKIKGSYGYAGGALYRARFGNIPIGPGAIAGRASDALANSTWANRAGTLRGMVGYRLRRNVVEPLANTSLGTSASTFRERQTFLDTRRREMDKNLEGKLGLIKNRQDAKDLKELDDKWEPLNAQYTPIDKRVKELEAFVGPLTHAEATELTTKKAEIARLKPEMDKLRPKREQLMANMAKMEGPEIVALNGKDIEGIIKHISDKQLKAIKESLKFSNKEKEKLEKKWHETSGKAPLGESKDQIRKLGEVSDELKKVSYNLTKLPEFTKLVKPLPGHTITVNLAATKRVKDELEKQVEEQKFERDDTGASPIRRQVARKAVAQLEKAAKQVEKLEEQIKEVPKEVGNVDEEGQFEHKG